jgi:high-affinity nickel-transport protein
MTLLTILALGFFLGMRHATDADHVVAVTTIVSRSRSPRLAMLIGAFWGLGHTVTILLVGGAIILFDVVIPPRLGLSMEFSVALMLVFLGTINLTGAIRHIHDVAHRSSSNAALSEASAEQPITKWGLRSLVVGIVHGLAGSAAVALLVLTTIHDASLALLYLIIFGAGTVVGMMLLTTAMSVPVGVASRRFDSFGRRLAQVTGVASIAFGCFLAYQIGVVDGLFKSEVTWSPK